MKFTYLKAWIFPVACAFLFSCEKEEIVSENSSIDEKTIMVKDGYLVFPDLKSFEDTKSTLTNLSEKEKDAWEKGFKTFESQRSIYEKAVYQNYLLNEELERLVNAGEREVEDIIQKRDHIAPYVKENEEIFKYTDRGTFNLAIEGHQPYIEYFVNKDGVVQVGDSIFHYSDGFVRIILDNDESKLCKITSYIESNKKDKVAVIQVKRSTSKDFNFPNGAMMGTFGCQDENDGQRVTGQAVTGLSTTVDMYGQHGCAGSVIYQPYAYIRAVNEAKNWFGWYNKPTSYLRIVGKNIYYMSPGYNIHKPNINFDVSTMGDEKSEIKRIIYYTNTWYCGADNFHSMTGEAVFYGRGGTQCTWRSL